VALASCPPEGLVLLGCTPIQLVASAPKCSDSGDIIACGHLPRHRARRGRPSRTRRPPSGKDGTPASRRAGRAVLSAVPASPHSPGSPILEPAFRLQPVESASASRVTAYPMRRALTEAQPVARQSAALTAARHMLSSAETAPGSPVDPSMALRMQRLQRTLGGASANVARCGRCS
jgi:hypothetical protein